MDKTASKITRPLSVSETVLNQLRKDIIEDVFHFGDKISEAHLSKIYQVTKAPIRWAFNKLDGEGLIDIKAQSGTYIFQPSLDDIASLCELRVAMEMEALKLAIIRSPNLLANELASICEKMQQAQKQHNKIAYQNLDVDYHQAILAAANSPLLLETYQDKVQSRISAVRYRLAKKPEHESSSIKDHIKLSELIKNNNYDEAKHLLRKHIEFSKSYYQAITEST